MPKFNVMANHLVPRHSVMTHDEVEEMLSTYGIDRTKLPKILINDPCARAIGASPGDVIRIERKSPTAGTSLYYRIVVEERSVP
ncbi:MAG: DNA-directed RNA polymerase subunit H [Candidatus Thermoplasmatota archaeon]|nr:DNA-directed RNA polymerase subunit H [Candidatus Thermoplasmatota archaeon]